MGYKNILLAIDDSEHSEKAAKATAELAKSLAAKVTVIHVVAPFNAAIHYEGLVPMIPQLVELYDELGNKILNKAKDILKDIEFETVLLHGSPAQEIIEFSKEGFDLLVVSAHGINSFGVFTMGSVANKVLHNCEISVLLVR